MQLAKITGINDAEKLKYFETAMGLQIPEQAVMVSAFDDSVIVKEFAFRLKEYKKKLTNCRELMEEDPIWEGWI